jgi:hypothetical protein
MTPRTARATLALLALAWACGEKPQAQEEAASDRDLELAIQRDTPAAALADRPPEATRPKPQPKPPAPKPAAPKPAPPPEPVTAIVAAGTSFDVTVDDTLSTKKNKVGDTFTARVAADVTAPDGAVLIPAGAVLNGAVTQVQASTETGREAVIGVAFQSVSFANRTYPVTASVTAAQVESQRTTSDKEQAAKIVGGAAAGALLGKLIGKDAKSTIIGAAAGAAAGTAIALGTADYAGVIPKGATLTLKLEEPIEVVVG